MNEDLAEKAFEDWKARNESVLMRHYPATVGWNGAANNYSYWCRKVYTGKEKIDAELK